MQDRVAAGKIEIWDTTVDLAEVQAVVKGLLHLLPAHAVQLLMAIFREDVAVLAPLVAIIRNVPLKRKILFHLVLPAPMGRTSESTPSAVLSEIRPKFFLGCIPFLTACRQRRKPNRKQRAFQRACPPRRRQNRRRRVSQRACLPRRRLWRVPSLPQCSIQTNSKVPFLFSSIDFCQAAFLLAL